jgi:hypothetical protein
MPNALAIYKMARVINTGEVYSNILGQTPTAIRDFHPKIQLIYDDGSCSPVPNEILASSYEKVWPETWSTLIRTTIGKAFETTYNPEEKSKKLYIFEYDDHYMSKFYVPFGERGLEFI